MGSHERANENTGLFTFDKAQGQDDDQAKDGCGNGKEPAEETANSGPSTAPFAKSANGSAQDDTIWVGAAESSDNDNRKGKAYETHSTDV